MNTTSIIKEIITKNGDEINQWIEDKYGKAPHLFYSSVDIRHSGHKIVPVDTNLFPAGFNLLSSKQKEQASKQVIKYFQEYYPSKKKVMLYPESHTRNKFYLENIFNIQEILVDAGLEVVIARSDLEIEDGSNAQYIELETALNNNIITHRAFKENGIIQTDNFIPDVIIANNDFSSGSPESLNDLKEQPVFPPVGMGWYKRRKTSHFETYEQLSKEFGRSFNLDPWLISASFTKCEKVNFKQKDGLECVANNVDKLLWKIKNKYEEYSIKEEPYVFIKANSGTYGMGIMIAKSGEDIMSINKKGRHTMDSTKENMGNSEVIIQEGIPTIDTAKGKPAEPMVYLVNSQAIGCNYRLNNNQDEFGNLNSKGMEFVNFESQETSNDSNCPVQEMIAKLASLAAARECYEDDWVI